MTIVFESPDISASNGLDVQYDLQRCTDEEVMTTQPWPPVIPTRMLQLVTTNLPPNDGSISGNCNKVCPTPREGCVLVTRNDDDEDCCGEEQCGLQP